MELVDFLFFLVKFWTAVITSIVRSLPPFKPKPKDITGEIALITGAGHGMGRLQAKEFSKLGAIVVTETVKSNKISPRNPDCLASCFLAWKLAITDTILTTPVVDLNEESNEETADIVREAGGRVFAYTCDISKKENIKKLAAEVRSDVGDVSILVNNAGVIYVADFLSITEEKVQRTMDVNVLAHFWLIREFLPSMKKKNHGHIVSLASKAGITGIQFMTDYCASKHAVVGLCEALYREMRATGYDGIHVTYVCPTFVNTGFVTNPSVRVGRIPEPEEVVDQLMKGVLTNQRTVAVPEDLRMAYFLRAILPRSAGEELLNFINPICDHVDAKKNH